MPDPPTSIAAPAGGGGVRRVTVDAWLDDCFAVAEEGLYGPQTALMHRHEQIRAPLFSAAFTTLAPVDSHCLLLRLPPASSPRPDSQLGVQASPQPASFNLNWWPPGQVRLMPRPTAAWRSALPLVPLPFLHAPDAHR